MLDAIRIADCEATLKSIVPGAGLQDHGGRGVMASWHVSVHYDFSLAPNQEYADRAVAVIAQRMHARAIHDLGLEPVLEGMRAEVRDFRRANEILQAELRQRNARVAMLEEAIAIRDAIGSDDA